MKYLSYLLACIISMALVQPALAYTPGSYMVKYAVLYDNKTGAITGFACENKRWKLDVCLNNTADCHQVSVYDTVNLPLTSTRKISLLDERCRRIEFKRADYWRSERTVSSSV